MGYHSLETHRSTPPFYAATMGAYYMHPPAYSSLPRDLHPMQNTCSTLPPEEYSLAYRYSVHGLLLHLCQAASALIRITCCTRIYPPWWLMRPYPMTEDHWVCSCLPLDNQHCLLVAETVLIPASVLWKYIIDQSGGWRSYVGRGTALERGAVQVRVAYFVRVRQ